MTVFLPCFLPSFYPPSFFYSHFSVDSTVIDILFDFTFTDGLSSLPFCTLFFLLRSFLFSSIHFSLTIFNSIRLYFISLLFCTFVFSSFSSFPLCSLFFNSIIFFSIFSVSWGAWWFESCSCPTICWGSRQQGYHKYVLHFCFSNQTLLYSPSAIMNNLFCFHFLFLVFDGSLLLFFLHFK